MYPTTTSKSRKRYGMYQCTCGNVFKAITAHIKSGHTQSCGCYQVSQSTTHGLSNTPLYRSWVDMMQRCYNPKDTGYPAYGAKGIITCDEWHDVNNFINDMKATYEEGLTIDRKDPNGNYNPSNCRWADAVTQARNKKRIMSTNKSGYRGVFLEKRKGKYKAGIMVNLKLKHLGYFTTALDAALAYDTYIVENNLEHTTNGLLS